MSTTPLEGFLALPAEIRNEIYELAFTPTIAGPFNLCEAAPPSNSLLLTNRQVHNEAVQYYLDAYKSYWRDSSFVIDRRIHMIIPVNKAKINALSHESTQNIRRLEITSKAGNRTASSTLLDVRGLCESTIKVEPAGSYPDRHSWVVRSRRADPFRTDTWDQEGAPRDALRQAEHRAPTLETQVSDVLEMYERWEADAVRHARVM